MMNDGRQFRIELRFYGHAAPQVDVIGTLELRRLLADLIASLEAAETHLTAYGFPVVASLNDVQIKIAQLPT